MEEKSLDEEKTESTEDKKGRTIRFVGCRNCGKTNVTLIKATDSYYCKFCFNKLGKKKYSKIGIKKKEVK